MNRVAFLSTGLAVKFLYDISKARVTIHNAEKIPKGSIIFASNHFTRIETVFLPYYLSRITDTPVWSLADATLFSGFLGEFISKLGAVSTRDPDRDRLIVKTLLTGEANWVIFPEGLMVKNKKLVHHGEFMLNSSDGMHPPHTGAATLALRTEFYRERLRHLTEKRPREASRLMKLFSIESLDPVLGGATSIVPVNITYYPVRARENVLSKLAANFLEEPSDRMIEELMTEGTMLLSGIDVDVRFGDPIKIQPRMEDPVIKWDIVSDEQFDFNDRIDSRETLRISSRKIMKDYMASIYKMTTINHDHIFASLLYRMDFEKIDPYDFKSRAFLATTFELDSEKYNLHTSMERSQTHLLTDDRYGKYENFISVALDKGLVSVDGNGNIIKNRSKFEADNDFHLVRVENPLSVMVNEIEPLGILLECIERLAKEAPCHIRRRVVERLMSGAVSRFEKDYDTWFAEGESKSPEIGMPCYIEGKGRKTGILLVHGYMAAPAEMKPLARYLGEKGYRVYVPRLRGHGTSPEDLAGTNFMDWVTSVEEGYIILKNICDEVVLGGFSTGAGLVLDLASRVDGIKGVFAVAPPMKLQDFSSRFVPAVDLWNQLMKKFRIGVVRKEFVENRPENPHINYLRNPIAGIRELERLMDNLEPRLGKVKAPVFILQSRRDPVVNPRGARKIFDLLGSEEKEYHLFNFDRHGILLHEGAERVFRTIYDFVEAL